ncbi:kinesin-like protein KIF13A isoform X7, partial [Tachysurus ichikawai]
MPELACKTHAAFLFLQVFAFDHCFWSMDESNIPKYA